MKAVFDALWESYVAVTPQARAIHDLLEARGEVIVNDHVAFRTFDVPGIDLDTLAAPWLAHGWRPTGTYRFDVKRLRAVSLSHHGGAWPRVFLSELETARFPAEVGEMARALATQATPGSSDPFALVTREPTWPPVSWALYERLLRHSEYAAWVAAFGLRANHFTVDVGALHGFSDVAAINALLVDHGFALNTAGGAIKGSEAIGLVQSSTLASRIPWAFDGGQVHVVPSCYYEMAQRHPDPATGRLFDGFVADSADRIFESTDR